MKPSERDDLLIRLDERSRNTYRLVEALEQHNREQNGTILALIGCCKTNTVWRKIIIGIGTPGLIALISYLVLSA